MDLENQVAIVTGGSSGSGLETVRVLAGRGARVVVADVQEPVDALPDGTVFVKTDVTDLADCEEAVRRASEQEGVLSILINCAGLGEFGDVETTTLASWERVMAVNVTGTFLMSKAAMPHLKEARGSVVNIGSGAGVIGTPTSVAYCAAKGAVVNMTRAMALDAAPHGVRVNCVSPGVVDTPFNQRIVASAEDPDAVLRAQIGAHPLGRLATPIDISSAVSFLASDAAAFITGANLMVDGGLTAQ